MARPTQTEVNSIATPARMSANHLPPGVVPVLCYHRFLPGFSQYKNTVFSVSPQVLEQHFELIRDRNLRTLSISEYTAIATGRAEPEPDSILVTIDDGYVDVLSHAMPLAEKFSVRLNLFVLTSEIGRGSPFVVGPTTAQIKASMDADPRLWELFSWDELRQLRDQGVGIGLHGYRHVGLSTVPPDELKRELQLAVELFEKELGYYPESFALPYGNPRTYTVENLQLIHGMEIPVIFNSQRDVSRLPQSSSPQPRFVVQQNEALRSFAAKLSGSIALPHKLKQIIRQHPRLDLKSGNH